MKEWADDEKPREKLMQKGVTALSTVELLAILLRSGTGKESALDVARAIFSDCRNDVNVLAHMNALDLMNKYKGIGIAKATSIVAAIELGQRKLLSEPGLSVAIRSSNDIFKYFAPLIQDLDHEEFWVIYLNRANHVTGRTKLSAGGMSSTVTDVRLLFRKALDVKAYAIVIAHNHPSGSTLPSESDKVLTEQIYDAGKIIGIKLIDHLIISGRDYYSFVDDGLLDARS